MASFRRFAIGRRSHSIARRLAHTDTKVWSWGRGIFGSLGDGFEDRNEPALIASLKETPIKSIACGWGSSLAISESGGLYEWGWEHDMHTLLRVGARFDRAPSMVQALQQSWFRWWKYLPDVFQMRRGNAIPTLVNELKGIPIRQATAGGSFCAAVAESGEVYSWGVNNHGQCGQETVSSRAAVDQVKAIKGAKIVQASAGLDFLHLLTDQGQVLACGQGNRGQLGQLATSSSSKFELHIPQLISQIDANDLDVLYPQHAATNSSSITSDLHEAVQPTLPPIKQIATGFSHAMYLTQSGKVLTCGRGRSGVLGLSPEGENAHVTVTDDEGEERPAWTQLEDVFVPRVVRALQHKNVVQIAAGQHHSVALTDKNELYTWGLSKFGQCGRPATQSIQWALTPYAQDRNISLLRDGIMMTPGRIVLPEHIRVKKIIAGFYTTAIITEDDEAYFFGTDSHESKPCMPGHKVASLAFGWRHALGLAPEPKSE
eukprot:TRINITY_DN1120_c0_g2_i1.p1 TRINITY_DN1120_c0_g2~~TRINITY_DN1120_c0_g2_i1.p1  ORF type:complete len:506 (+),score=98.82 TRINITY_DN1120_c0_g2_i1:58-1518(+)